MVGLEPTRLSPWHFKCHVFTFSPQGHGTPCRIRTHNPQVRGLMLCSSWAKEVNWLRRAESNRLRPDYEPGMQPLHLSAIFGAATRNCTQNLLFTRELLY